MPSKEELLAKALGSLKSPITGLVNVLNGNIRGLVIALNAIAENKQQMPKRQAKMLIQKLYFMEV